LAVQAARRTDGVEYGREHCFINAQCKACSAVAPLLCIRSIAFYPSHRGSSVCSSVCRSVLSPLLVRPARDLLPRGRLHRSEDSGTSRSRLRSRGRGRSAGMEHQIDRGIEQRKLLPHGLAHSALDAVRSTALPIALPTVRPTRAAFALTPRTEVPSGPSAAAAQRSSSSVW